MTPTPGKAPPPAPSSSGLNFWPALTAAILILGWAAALVLPVLEPMRQGVSPLALYGLIGLGLLGAGLLVNTGRPRLALLHAALLIVLVVLPRPF